MASAGVTEYFTAFSIHLRKYLQGQYCYPFTAEKLEKSVTSSQRRYVLFSGFPVSPFVAQCPTPGPLASPPDEGRWTSTTWLRYLWEASLQTISFLFIDANSGERNKWSKADGEHLPSKPTHDLVTSFSEIVLLK